MRGNALGGYPGSRGDGRPRRQAFDTIAVKHAGAVPGIARFAGDTQMPQFAVAESVCGPSIDHETDSHAGAHGHIGEVRQMPGCAPSALGQRGAVHVGIESHGQGEAFREAPGHIGVSPARLRRRSNRAIVRRCTVQIDRAEGGDAQCRDGAVKRLPIAQYGLDCAQGCRRVLAGGNRGLRADVVRAGADQTYALGSAQLHTAQQWLVYAAHDAVDANRFARLEKPRGGGHRPQRSGVRRPRDCGAPVYHGGRKQRRSTWLSPISSTCAAIR